MGFTSLFGRSQAGCNFIFTAQSRGKNVVAIVTICPEANTLPPVENKTFGFMQNNGTNSQGRTIGCRRQNNCFTVIFIHLKFYPNSISYCDTPAELS